MRIRTSCLVLLFIFNAWQAGAQADSILALPKEEQLTALWRWYNARVGPASRDLDLQLEKMEDAFRKKRNEPLYREAWYLHKYYISGNNVYEDTALVILDNAIEFARDRDWVAQLAELFVHKGQVQIIQSRTISGFENLMKGYELIRKIGYTSFPMIHQILLTIGLNYYNLGDYENAIQYLRESLDNQPPWETAHFEAHHRNTIGLCYLRLEKYDSAVIHYTKAHEAATSIGFEFWAALANGNLGNAYFQMGDYDKALPLIENDFTTSLKYKEVGSALNASLGLATIYLKKGNRQKAEYYVQYSRDHVDRADDKAMAAFYHNLYSFAKMKGDYTAAVTYADSARHYQDKMDARSEKAVLEKARLQLEMERHSAAIDELESTRKRQVLIRNGLLAILLLSATVTLLLINRRSLRRRKELELAKAELIHFTNAIREKNELIDSFSEEIEKMRLSDQYSQNERSQQLVQLLQASILTEEDWKHFKTMFDKVHPGFFIRLKSKMPDLTPAETRLIALTKLKLATREMASMLGISYESMKKTRQRLRKKINLPEEGSLDELVDLI